MALARLGLGRGGQAGGTSGNLRSRTLAGTQCNVPVAEFVSFSSHPSKIHHTQALVSKGDTQRARRQAEQTKEHPSCSTANLEALPAPHPPETHQGLPTPHTALPP